MVILENKGNGTIIIMASDMGVKLPMVYTRDEGWGTGVTTIPETMDGYARVDDRERREKLLSEAIKALPPFKIICLCGKEFEIERDASRYVLPNHTNNKGEVCRGSLIMGSDQMINLSMLNRDMDSR